MKNIEIKKVDELGRISIPKNIRKKLNIKTNDNIKIYIDNSNIILKKYSILKDISSYIQTIIDLVNSFINKTIIVADKDIVLAVSGKKKDIYLNKNISEELLSSIKRRENILQNHFKSFKVIKSEKLSCSYITISIVKNNEEVGIIVVIDEEEKLTNYEKKAANLILSFILKALEE